MPDLDDAGHDPDAPIAVDEEGQPLDDGPPEQITKEAFWVVFQTAFNMPGMILSDLKPMGIQPGEESGARAASDATYSLLEIYFPSALMPQSETLAHILIAGPFFVGKAMVVREIIRSMKAKPIPQGKPNPSKNEPAQDAPKGDNWHLPGQEKAA